MVVLVFRLGSMACESDGPVDAEVSQRLNHTSGGTRVNKKTKNKKEQKQRRGESRVCLPLRSVIASMALLWFSSVVLFLSLYCTRFHIQTLRSTCLVQ